MGGYASPVQFSPDGRLVAVGYSTGEADVLAASTGHLVVRDTSSASIAAGDLAIPPSDGSLVTVSLDGVFRIWSMHGSQQLRFQAPADAAVDFPPSGTGLVLIGDQGEIVDRSTGAVLRRFPGFPASSVFQTCGPGCVATSPELGWLTYLDPSSASPRIVELHGRTGQLAGAADVARLDSQGVAPDGQVVTGYADGDQLFAEVIDPRSGHMRALQTAASSDGCGATTPSFTPDSSLVAIDDGCIHLVVWELRSGRIVRTITLPGRATGPAHLSPDGRYVLAPIGGGSFVRVDLATGRTVEIPGEGTEGDVLAISPNGRFYAVGHQDGTVDEYDGDSLQLVRVHTLANPIQALVFSPGSAELAVEDTNNVVWLWDTCAICENPTALARRAAQESIRQLTPGEPATFDVG
jgi:WD40 repeat protein